MHNDGDEPLFQRVVTSTYRHFETLTRAAGRWTRWLWPPVAPFVTIVATDAAGTVMQSGGGRAAVGAVTFKFTLSKPSTSFSEPDITHNCAGHPRPQFFGRSPAERQKRVYYLVCAHVPALQVSVGVGANMFYDGGNRGNTASEVFVLTMAA